MDLRLNLQDLKTPEDIQKLVSAISEMADNLDVLFTETAPNGNISGRIGRIAIYKNGSTYEQWQNVDGGTTWQRVDGANKALSNLVSVAINISLISDTDDTDDLGSATKEFKDLYIDGLAYIDQLGENLDCNDKQLTNLIIENRTDDTGMTVTGQIWFRTDV